MQRVGMPAAADRLRRQQVTGWRCIGDLGRRALTLTLRTARPPQQVQYAFLAGLGLVLLLIPVNRVLASRIQAASVSMMGAKDRWGQLAVQAFQLGGPPVVPPGQQAVRACQLRAVVHPSQCDRRPIALGTGLRVGLCTEVGRNWRQVRAVRLDLTMVLRTNQASAGPCLLQHPPSRPSPAGVCVR